MNHTIGTILALLGTLIICLAIPVCGWWFGSRKGRCFARPFLLGAVTFLLSQIFLRLPLVDLSMAWSPLHALLENIWVYALFLGITAGLFEEGSRYLSLRFGLPQNASYPHALLFGIGWSSSAAVWIVGIPSLYQLLLLLQGSASEVSPVLLIFSGIERILYTTLQLLFSCIVFTLTQQGKKGLFRLPLCMLAHLLIETPIPLLLNEFQTPTWLVEGYLSLLALLALTLLLQGRARKKTSAVPHSSTPAPPASSDGILNQPSS